MRKKIFVLLLVIFAFSLIFADYNPPMFSTTSTKGLVKLSQHFLTIDLSKVTSGNINIPSIFMYEGNSTLTDSNYYRVDFLFDSYQYKYLIPYLKIDAYVNLKKVSGYYYGKKIYSSYIHVQKVTSNKYVAIVRFNSEKLIINNKSYKSSLPIVFKLYTTKTIAERFTLVHAIYKIESPKKMTNVKVNFSSVPQGAVVYLGAKMLGITPFYTYLKPGSYLVRFFKKGHPQQDIKFIAKGESINVSVSFEQKQVIQNGTVVLSIDPPDATIMFDGKISPQNTFKLPVGSYTVSISAEGYQNTYFTFNVEANKTKTYYISLKPIYATLILNIIPNDNFKVYIDNKYIPGNVFKLEPGIHGVIIESNGYKKDSFAVNLTPNEKMTLNVALQPLKGYLTILCNIASKVYINGTFIGSTNISKYELSSGKYNVEITNSLFDFKTSVTIEAGKEKLINLDVGIK